MDKYYGIKKAQVITSNIQYQTKKIKHEKPKHSYEFKLFLRCLVCFLLIFMCAIGKYVVYQPINTASNFIIEELNKDYLDIVAEYIEKANEQE